MKPYQDRDWLYKKYVDEELTIHQIAKICNICSWSIRNGLLKNHIPIRSRSEIQKRRQAKRLGNYKNRDWLDFKYNMDNLSSQQIGALCGISGSIIRKWIRRLGVRQKTNAETRLKDRFSNTMKTYRSKSWLIDKYEKERLSADAVAKLCGTNGSTTRVWLRKYGIPLRTLRESHLGYQPSRITRQRMSISQKERLRQHPEAIKRGSENPLYINGNGNLPYPEAFNKELKKQIRLRDGFRCQLCGTSIKEKRLHIHHINYDIHDNRKRNLISLCSTHHNRANYSREKWQLAFDTYQAIRHLSA
jgi:transposase